MPEWRIVIIVVSGLATIISGELIVYRDHFGVSEHMIWLLLRMWLITALIWLYRMWLRIRRDPLLALCATLGYACMVVSLLDLFLPVPGMLMLAIGIPTVLLGIGLSIRYCLQMRRLQRKIDDLNDRGASS